MLPACGAQTQNIAATEPKPETAPAKHVAAAPAEAEPLPAKEERRVDLSHAVGDYIIRPYKNGSVWLDQNIGDLSLEVAANYQREVQMRNDTDFGGTGSGSDSLGVVVGTWREIPHLPMSGREYARFSLLNVFRETGGAFQNRSFRALFFGMCLATIMLSAEGVLSPYMNVHFWGLTINGLFWPRTLGISSPARRKELLVRDGVEAFLTRSAKEK